MNIEISIDFRKNAFFRRDTMIAIEFVVVWLVKRLTFVHHYHHHHTYTFEWRKHHRIKWTVQPRIEKPCVYFSLWIASHILSAGWMCRSVHSPNEPIQKNHEQRNRSTILFRCASLCVNFNCIVYTAVKVDFQGRY